ncbi:hypothetical protein D4764_06G0009260 [Takifugu flavidus]|uniref:Uncharacterized protein n=1 Tax=Takifugu flavidus TaxID=433684 RepID=A0A5C6MWE6_9TELE|nr:hypothetical protein D4764_06G0009260 [Takifugu flavidus]
MGAAEQQCEGKELSPAGTRSHLISLYDRRRRAERSSCADQENVAVASKEREGGRERERETAASLEIGSSSSPKQCRRKSPFPHPCNLREAIRQLGTLFHCGKRERKSNSIGSSAQRAASKRIGDIRHPRFGAQRIEEGGKAIGQADNG